MKLLKNRNVLLWGSFGLIVLAVGFVAILENVSSSSSGDVRARAATVKTLNVDATVSTIDTTTRTITVADLYIADDSRSGDPKNLGAWIVTAPKNFEMTSVSPGSNVVIGVDPTTFLALKHTLTALTIAPAK